MLKMKCTRLSAVALGVALGVLKGGWMLVVGLSAWQGGFGLELVHHWATLYPGVDVSLKGACVVTAWGFLTGFSIGLLLAWVYNLCLCCCSHAHGKCCKAIGEVCKEEGKH